MRRFYIDFETWEINEEDEMQAELKVLALLKSGHVPTISSTDDTEDEEPFDVDSTNGVDIKEIA